MSSNITEVRVRPIAGTSGSWTSENITLEQGELGIETDTGNTKRGDGATTWNNLGYEKRLATPYDLTSANMTHTLGPITGYPQTESIYWENGGTYKLTIEDDDGNPLDFEGEGTGNIFVETDGTEWRVREYNDSGSNANGDWEKYINGKLVCSFLDTVAYITTGATGNIFTVTTVYTFPMTFISLPEVMPGSKYVSARVWGGGLNLVTTTGATFFLLGDRITASGYPYYIATGRWKA